MCVYIYIYIYIYYRYTSLCICMCERGIRAPMSTHIDTHEHSGIHGVIHVGMYMYMQPYTGVQRNV